MKKRWLGILLGVSLALLLAGGVALAASLYVEVDKECFECFPGPVGPTDEYIVWVTIGGWNPAYDLCFRWTIDGREYAYSCDDPPGVDPYTFPLWMYCDGDVVFDESWLGGEVGLANPLDGVEELYGTWKYRYWQEETGESDEVTFLFADDCFVAMFVPEPGTMVLLGSGLAGLAGYASVRLRARRKRE